jgi:hypothetical protein
MAARVASSREMYRSVKPDADAASYKRSGMNELRSLSGSLPRIAALSLMVTMAACDPIITIAGAAFPSWLICLIAGALVAAIIRPLLAASGLEAYLGPLEIFYPSLIALAAMVAWVVFFNRV